MKQMVERTFVVNTSPGHAWQVLIGAESWPSWARHIRRVELEPPGEVGPSSTATLTLTNRTRARVTVSRFEPPHRFRWHGTFLWLRLGYDHTVTPTDDGRAEITFTVDGEGIGARSIGRVFARIYARNLDRAIPRLQAQLDGAAPENPNGPESHEIL